MITEMKRLKRRSQWIGVSPLMSRKGTDRHGGVLIVVMVVEYSESGKKVSSFDLLHFNVDNERLKSVSYIVLGW